MAEHLGMVIDAKNCIGCNACAVACKVENNIPQGVWWNRIFTEGGDGIGTAAGTHPTASVAGSLKLGFLPVACQHCENPACTKVCPVGATFKDPDTGVVRQDYEKCIGCRMCMAACPYTGVRSFNWAEPAYYVDHTMGDAAVPTHQKHTVEKCTLCWHRLAQGLQPACIEHCCAKIRYFGDFNDPDSEVSKLIATRQYRTLLPEKGTRPSVYYLV